MSNFSFFVRFSVNGVFYSPLPPFFALYSQPSFSVYPIITFFICLVLRDPRRILRFLLFSTFCFPFLYFTDPHFSFLLCPLSFFYSFQHTRPPPTDTPLCRPFAGTFRAPPPFSSPSLILGPWCYPLISPGGVCAQCGCARATETPSGPSPPPSFPIRFSTPTILLLCLVQCFFFIKSSSAFSNQKFPPHLTSKDPLTLREFHPQLTGPFFFFSLSLFPPVFVNPFLPTVPAPDLSASCGPSGLIFSKLPNSLPYSSYLPPL